MLCACLALTACHSLRLPCISGLVRPAPIYVDPEGFCALQQEIRCLNHRFAPYQRAMDNCHFPKPVCKRLIRIDDALQHINAAILSREIAPEKIQRQIHWIQRDLSWVEARIGVYPNLDLCCKSPEAMAASLDAWIDQANGRRASGKPVMGTTGR